MRLANIAAIFLACLANLLTAAPALAMPPLPSSFYGTVKFNNTGVPDGTLIQALIDRQVFGEAYTQTYQGDSVYALDVRGDDSATTEREGGREGEVIQFKIGNILAGQTATWHSGVNANLNLTALSSTPLVTPQPMHTSPPTQTPIQPPSATPFQAKTAAASPTSLTPRHDPATPFNPAQFIPRSQTAVATSGPGQVIAASSPIPSPRPASQVYTMFKSPVPASPEAEKQNSSGAAWPMVLLAASLLALLAWWFLRKK
jgi:hypothetical protein